MRAVLVSSFLLLLCVTSGLGNRAKWNQVTDDTVEQMKYVSGICHMMKSLVNMTGPLGDKIAMDIQDDNGTWDALIAGFEEMTSPATDLLSMDFNVTMMYLMELMQGVMNETMGDMGDEMGEIKDMIHVFLNLTKVLVDVDDSFGDVIDGMKGMMDQMMGNMTGMGDMKLGLDGLFQGEVGEMMCHLMKGGAEFADKTMGNGLIGGGMGGQVGMYMMGMMEIGEGLMEGAAGMFDGMLEMADMFGCPGEMDGPLAAFGNMTGSWYDMVEKMESFMRMTGSVKTDKALTELWYDKLQMVAFFANISETIGGMGGGPSKNVSYLVSSLMMGDMEGAERALKQLEMTHKMGAAGQPGDIADKLNHTSMLLKEMMENPGGVMAGLVDKEQELMDTLTGLQEQMGGALEEAGMTADEAIGMLEVHGDELWEHMTSMGENAMGVMLKEVMINFKNMSGPWETMKKDMDEFFGSTKSMGGLFGCKANMTVKIGDKSEAWVESKHKNGTVMMEMDQFFGMIEAMIFEHGDIIFEDSMMYIGAVSHLTKVMHHHMKGFLGSMADYIGCGANMTGAMDMMEPNSNDSWEHVHDLKRLIGNMTHEMGHKLGVLVGHKCNMMSLKQMMEILMRQNVMQLHMAEIQAIHANMFEMMWMHAEKSFDHWINSKGMMSLGDFLNGQVSADVMRMITPDMLRSLSPEAIEIMGKHLSPENRDALCFTVVKSGDTDLLQFLIRAGVNCLDALISDPSIKPDDGAAHKFLDTLKDEMPPTDWGRSGWEAALAVGSALEPSDLRSMNTSVMKDLVKDGSISFDAFSDNPSGQRAFNDRLKDAYGNPDAWTVSELNELGGDLIANLDIDDMKSLDAAAIGATLEKYRNITFSDKKREAAFAAKVVDGLGGVSAASTWTSADIENAAKYTLNNPRVLAQLSDANLLDAVEAFAEHIVDKKDAVTLARKLAATSDYSDPSAVTGNQLKELGKAVCGFPPSFTDSLSASALEASLDDINTGDFPRNQARTMMNKLQNRGVFDTSSMTGSDLERAGTLLAGFDSDELADIPPSAVNDSLATLGDLDLSEDQGRALVKQLKNLMGGDFSSSGQTFPAKAMKKLFKHVTRSELVDLVAAGHLEFDCDSDSLDIEVDASQAASIMASVKETYGDLGNTNTNYTSSCFEVWGKIAAKGMSAKDLEDLREDDEMPSIIEKLKAYTSEMEESQIKAIAKKIRRKYAGNDTMASVVDKSVASQLAPFMAHLTDDELDMFNASVRPTIAKGMGNANTKRFKRSEVQRLKKYALANVLRDDTDTVTDRTNSADLDDNDIRELGSLMCGLEASDMEKLTLEAIESNIGNMAACVYSTETGEALMNRAVALSADMFDSTDNLIAAGHLLVHLPADKIEALSADTLADAFLDLAESFDEYDEALEQRDESFSIEVDSTQRSNDSSARQSIFQNGLNALSDSGIASRRRRSPRARRATNAVSCADIQSMGGSVTSLTTDDIAAIDATEFEDCLETLGAVSSWSDEQLDALVTQAKSVLGAVDTWNAEETRQAGSIVAGLTSAEISTLSLSTDGVMSSVGQHDIYDSAQLASGYSRWLSLTQSDSVTNVDADELNTIGHFACGIDTSDISSIDAAVYLDAASSIGSLTTCEETQLAAFALLAKDDNAFGSDVTAWDSSTISTVGSVMGGLTKPEISTLSEEQIQSLTPSAIAQMPPSNFAGFSSTQIGYFSTSQASAVTASQQAALDSEQLQALVDAGATQQVVLDNSASAMAPLTIVLLVISFFAIQW